MLRRAPRTHFIQNTPPGHGERSACGAALLEHSGVPVIPSCPLLLTAEPGGARPAGTGTFWVLIPGPNKAREEGMEGIFSHPPGTEIEEESQFCNIQLPQRDLTGPVSLPNLTGSPSALSSMAQIYRC